MSRRQIEVLEMIASDMEQDVKNANGMPFDGKTLAKLHGELCATIKALANIMKAHIEDGAKEDD